MPSPKTTDIRISPFIGERISRLDESPLEIVPASAFTIEELVAAYNQTRVDYIVPMPMNSERLAEYIRHYDVDLARSAVALDEGEPLGLAMLGVRDDHTWITRLGVIPSKRKRGTGRALMENLIAQSESLGVSHVILEVIVGNDPAYHLFRRLGFDEVRELLVMRRPPGPPNMDVGPYDLHVLGERQAANLLQDRQSMPSWLDETASLSNVANLTGLRVSLPESDRGWLIYQESTFQLGRLVFQTNLGDPHRVALALLHALHQSHPAADTKSENLPADDPHWPALQEMGYFESFRRIEMRLNL
jgi:ribosomal protein S18 acetylase RimI-like enzyme